MSQVGNWLTMVAQTLLVLELTDSGVALGFLAAAQFGPVLVLGAWAGVVADRSDKRKLLFIRPGARHGRSRFALAALAFMGPPPLAGIYALALVGWRHHRLRQPDPAVLRRRDGAARTTSTTPSA